MRHKHSEYMHWAKMRKRARFDLATSGVGSFPLRDLPFDFSRLEIHGDNSYGYGRLTGAIASKYAVDPDSVVEAAGTSMANHLAMAAILEPGDEAIIEHPVYGPLMDAALYLEADVKRFDRPEASGYAIDPDAIRRAITPRTRLIVITNLHNPSSVLTPEPVLREVGDIARSAGAYVLVDEVYLDAVYEGTPRTSLHLGPEFVVTSSLTKIYGLSGLRCGWILAEPDLARKIRLLNDIYAATPSHPSEILSVAAFENLDAIRERARRIVMADRARLSEFLTQHRSVSAVHTEWGTTALIRLANGDADGFLTRLSEQHETAAVPGRFFGKPGHFRIGMGVNSEMFAEGLRRMGQELKE